MIQRRNGNSAVTKRRGKMGTVTLRSQESWRIIVASGGSSTRSDRRQNAKHRAVCHWIGHEKLRLCWGTKLEVGRQSMSAPTSCECKQTIPSWTIKQDKPQPGRLWRYQRWRRPVGCQVGAVQFEQNCRQPGWASTVTAFHLPAEGPRIRAQ